MHKKQWEWCAHHGEEYDIAKSFHNESRLPNRPGFDLERWLIKLDYAEYNDGSSTITRAYLFLCEGWQQLTEKQREDC